MIALLAALAGAQTPLIQPRDMWRIQGGGPVDPAWTEVAFDDTTWGGGQTQIGFGEQDQDRTVLPSASAPWTTLYLRRGFQIDDLTDIDELVMELLVDDGAAVYLNGTEVHRTNLPAGPLDADTLALTDVDGHDEHRFAIVRLPANELVVGANVLAVEVHQSAVDSDDLSFDLALTATDGAVRLLRGPYLQLGTPESVVVRWRTDAPVAGRVSVGSAPGALDQVFDGPVGTDHAIEITGLSAATDYHYRVGDAAGFLDAEAATFRTAPEPGSDTPTRIWVIGDAGTASAGQEMVRDAYVAWTGETRTDLWLMLGDNAYGDGTDAQYQRAVFDVYPEMLRSSVTWPTIGNHDGHTLTADGQIGPYFDLFTLPSGGEAGGVPSGTEAYYSFDWANIHFVVLDSYASQIASGSPQWQWLEEDLLAADADWIIAYWHHPPYTKGTHDSDFELNHVVMRSVVLPILEEHGVDLVLGGHSHGYERSFLLDGHYGPSTSLLPEMILDAGDGREEGTGPYHKPAGATPHDGAVYVVAGSSGQIGLAAYNHPVHLVGTGTLGSFVLDVEGNRLDATFVSSIGEELDHFTMVKSGADSADPRKKRRDGCGCATGGVGGLGPAAVLLTVLGLRRRKSAALLLLGATAASAHPVAEVRMVASDQALQIAPCDVPAQLRRAEILADDGRFSEALDDVERALLCAPGDPAVAVARGRVLLGLGRPDEAHLELAYAATLSPTVPLWAELARAEVASGRCEDGALHWELHVDGAARPSPDALLEWSRALQCAGDLEGALAAVDRGLATLGPVVALQREGIELLAELGHTEAAVMRANAARGAHPAPVTWLAMAVRIWSDAGEAERAAEARGELLQAVEALPPRARNSRAVARLVEES